MKENKRILIISGGEVNLRFLQNHLESNHYDTTIVVDRGLQAADACNVKIDTLVGDFDSVDTSIFSQYKSKGIEILSFPPEKDMTDTEIALSMAISLHPKEIVLIGATGTRMDHSLANVHLLLTTLDKGVNAYLLNEHNKIYLKNQSFCIRRNEQYGDFVSLLPFGQKVSGLSLIGMKYPLHHVELFSGSSLGISNEIVSDEARIEFHEGILLVMETKD